MDTTKTFVEFDTALKIANKMCKPWQYATIVLSLITLGLLYTIITAEVVADSTIEATGITAESLTTDTNIKG